MHILVSLNVKHHLAYVIYCHAVRKCVELYTLVYLLSPTRLMVGSLRRNAGKYGLLKTRWARHAALQPCQFWRLFVQQARHNDLLTAA
jgi:hypothetical protein